MAALLYGGVASIASMPAAAQSTVPGVAAVDAPHIALLLPVDSSVFRRHAEALRDGFIAASKTENKPPLPVRVYAVGDDPKLAASTYQQAVQTGARLVVGPLIRSAVTAVAGSDVGVPTLVLNLPEGKTPNRPNLHVLSLQIEVEARQAARQAHRDGKRAAYTLTGDSALLKRLQAAFVDEFTKLGGKLIAEFAYNASPAELARLKQAAELRVADVVYLALDARQARTVRAYVDPLAVYASSQIYTADGGAAAGIDLAGVTFFDMPWLLQRDHPAVMVYPRQDFRGDADLERLYALGIDAWRIGQALLTRQADLTLDGVTGKLTPGRDRHFMREPVPARIGPVVPTAAVGPLPGPAPVPPPKPIPVKP